MPPKKEDLAKQLAEAEAKAAALEARLAEVGAVANPDDSPSEVMMKQFMAMFKAQQDATQAQLQVQKEAAQLQLKAQIEAANAAKEVADAQLKSAKEDRDLLKGQLNALMDELVDAKRKGTPANNTPSRLKVTPPPKLGTEMSVAKLKAWRKAWEDYAEMVKVSEMSLGEQQSLFRSLLSLDMRDVLEERIGVKKDHKPEDILDDIEAFIRKKRSVLLDMCAFDNRKQKTGENFDSYLVAIQQLAQDADLTFEHCDQCKVKCLDRRLAGRIISGILDERTRTKLLEEEKFPSKDRVVEICAARESARSNNKEQWGQTGVSSVKRRHKRGRDQSQNRSGEAKKDGNCHNCGWGEHKSKENCPAKDKECTFCKSKGHFAKVCKKKKQQESSKSKPQDGKKFGRITRYDKVDRVGIVNRIGSNSPAVSVEVTSPKTRKSLGWHDAIADTGAEACVAGLQLLRSLGVSKKILQPAKTRMFSFSGKQEKCLGILLVELANEHYKALVEVNICPHVSDNLLLSLEVSKALGYVRPEFPEIIPPTEHPDPTATARWDPVAISSTHIKESWVLDDSATEVELKEMRERLIAAYPDVFYDGHGLPPMTGETMHISLEENAVPFKVTTARKLPHAAREDIKKQLEDMVKQLIIAPVNHPTKWVHPMVVVLKADGTWRLCVDLTKLNKYVLRPYYPMTTPKDAVELPRTARVFACLDAKTGYWQILLDEESQELTTFITPYGRYKFLRNPMGLASAQDEYCRRGDEALAGVINLRKVVDDILVYGQNNQELLNSVREVLERCREHKITLNAKKFQFGLEEINYVGYKVSSDGVRADESKLSAIANFPQPTNLVELRSFMGMVNQFQDFTPCIAAAAEPLRGLMRPRNEFLWTEDHDLAFGKVKSALVSPPVLAQFDPKFPIMLQTDASRLKGLGFALLQKHDERWSLIMCGSRFLSDTESRYAMIELELLAAVWAVTIKCKSHLQGLKFTLVVDHKPLLPILNSFTLDMVDNPRLRRLKEKLAFYRFDTVWKRGKEHCIPDALSRAPIADPTKEDCFTDELEEYVSSVVRAGAASLRPEHLKDPYLEKLKAAAVADPSYVTLLEAVRTGFPDKKPEALGILQDFWNVRDNLTSQDNLVLRGAQIVVPAAMRKEVLADLHHSHQGIERTKRRARQTVFWPGINSDIKSTVEACEACQTHLPSQQKESLISDPLATRPFEETSADLFSHGKFHYLVHVDKYSGWPTVHVWKSDPTSQQVITALLQDFAVYGVPLRLRSDGGPQFTSSTFNSFLQEWKISPGVSSPHYPQSNGHAEAAVKAMKGLVIKTGCKGNLKDEAFLSGLLEWRCMPKDHGCSPAQLLFGRSIRSRVPISELALDGADPKNLARRQEQKDKTTSQYDSRARDLPALKPGQAVRIQNTKSKLWDTVGVVVRAEAKQRNYLLKVDTHVFIWRNRRYLRPVSSAVTEHLGELPSTPPPMLSTRGRRRQGERKSVTFKLPDKETKPTPSPAPRRSKRTRKRPERLGVQSA